MNQLLMFDLLFKLDDKGAHFIQSEPRHIQTEPSIYIGSGSHVSCHQLNILKATPKTHVKDSVTVLVVTHLINHLLLIFFYTY